MAIWLYVRFTLSFRDVEDLLAERGIVVSYETVRRWVNHFGPRIATFALNAGLWFRRTCFVIVSPDPQPPWPLSGKNSTSPAVQICRATSVVGVETQPMSLLDVGKWRIE
jgi:hypothetical protein